MNTAALGRFIQLADGHAKAAGGATAAGSRVRQDLELHGHPSRDKAPLAGMIGKPPAAVQSEQGSTASHARVREWLAQIVR
jgi:hypothetical protein